MFASTPSLRQPCQICSQFGILLQHVRTVKVSTTQREKSPAFFIVRMSSWVKEKATCMHKQIYGVLTAGAVMTGLFL